MSGCGYRKVLPVSRAGFTLIELLVVISIIAMLMSIMLPGLSNAREMGRRVVCLANIRSLTQAWLMYAIDNDDLLCSPDTLENDGSASDGRDYHWVADGADLPGNTVGGTEQAIRDGVLISYLSDTAKVYKCKSDKTNLLRSYAISNTMAGYNCGCGNMTVPYTALGQVDQPSAKLAFIDADSILPAAEPKWIQGGFWPISGIDPATATWAVPQYNNLTSRHSDGTNMSFADTHCEYRRWRDRRTAAIGNWDLSADNMGPNNRDLDFFLEALKGPMDK